MDWYITVFFMLLHPGPVSLPIESAYPESKVAIKKSKISDFKYIPEGHKGIWKEFNDMTLQWPTNKNRVEDWVKMWKGLFEFSITICFNIFTTNYEPVSYTHLDVYKRQHYSVL